MTDKPTQDQLLEAISDNTKRALHYSRLRFLATWLSLALLAILTAAALTIAMRSADADLEQTDEIAKLASADANAAQATTDDVVKYLQGEQGIPGVPGANGVDGTPGQPSGEPGPAGEPGPSGDPGVPGTPGPQGTQGTAGVAGAAGQNGQDANERGPEGTAGPAGPEGPTGPQGERGPAGAQGPAAAVTTSVAIGQSPNNTDPHKVANAVCPDGRRASGGGFAIVPSDPGIIPTATGPVGNTGWSATIEQLSLPPGTAWQVLVFAICIG